MGKNKSDRPLSFLKEHPVRYVMAFFLAAILSSCVTPAPPWRINYLNEVKNNATQDDIIEKLGPPDRKQPLSDGKEIWEYRYTGSSVNSNQGYVYGRSECVEYILTFDQSKIFRNWARQSC